MVEAHFNLLYFRFYKLSSLINESRIDRRLEVPSIKTSLRRSVVGFYYCQRLPHYNDIVMVSR